MPRAQWCSTGVHVENVEYERASCDVARVAEGRAKPVRQIVIRQRPLL